MATFRGGQNLNFAIPSNYLKKLIVQLSPAKPLLQAKPSKSGSSILADISGRSTDGITGSKLTWKDYHFIIPGGYSDYSFSLQNRLRENVGNVYCLVIFYDAQGDPIDVDVVQFQELIPPGLAKRVTSKVHKSVQELTTRIDSKIPSTKVEFRILDFEIVE